MLPRNPILGERVDPTKTALIVVDMQNDFLRPGGAGVEWLKKRRAAEGVELRGQERMHTEVIPSIKRLIASARAVFVPVMWVLSSKTPATDARYWLSENSVTAQAGTWGAELISELEPEPSDLMFMKTRHSAFFGTNLDSVLRFNRIEGLVITGVGTPGCVEGTVRDAMTLDYWAVVPGDCCGSDDLDAHEMALVRIDRLFGMVTDSQSIISAWQATRKQHNPAEVQGRGGDILGTE